MVRSYFKTLLERRRKWETSCFLSETYWRSPKFRLRYLDLFGTSNSLAVCCLSFGAPKPVHMCVNLCCPLFCLAEWLVVFMFYVKKKKMVKNLYLLSVLSVLVYTEEANLRCLTFISRSKTQLEKKKAICSSGQWWHTPLIPALGRQSSGQHMACGAQANNRPPERARNSAGHGQLALVSG